MRLKGKQLEMALLKCSTSIEDNYVEYEMALRSHLGIYDYEPDYDDSGSYYLNLMNTPLCLIA